MRYISLVFWVFIIIMGAVFALQNSQLIEIHYYFGHARVYFPLLMVLLLAMGALLGVCAMLPSYLKKSHNARKHRNKVRRLEEEINNLRTIPIKDTH